VDPTPVFKDEGHEVLEGFGGGEVEEVRVVFELGEECGFRSGAIDADDEHGKTVGGAVKVDLSEGEIDKYDSLVSKVEGDVSPCALGDLTSLKVGCDIGTKWEARESGRLRG
jgi:hypothetical protein